MGPLIDLVVPGSFKSLKAALDNIYFRLERILNYGHGPSPSGPRTRVAYQSLYFVSEHVEFQRTSQCERFIGRS